MRKLAVPNVIGAESLRTAKNKSDRTRDFRSADLPHRLEQAVQRRLLAQPDLRFASLVVRRIPNGVCLEGVLEQEGDLDVCNLARTVDGVVAVLNHLVIQRPVSLY